MGLAHDAVEPVRPRGDLGAGAARFTSTAVDISLAADRYVLSALHYHVHRRLLEEGRRFGRLGEAIQLQLGNRRLAPERHDEGNMAIIDR